MKVRKELMVEKKLREKEKKEVQFNNSRNLLNENQVGHDGMFPIHTLSMHNLLNKDVDNNNTKDVRIEEMFEKLLHSAEETKSECQRMTNEVKNVWLWLIIY